ncbi:DUF1700 domain-containing protein [Clostridium folliculivorans]|uniref:DUF1700 domain-containing protein n=1 Tax=Clostridium folliculivorans TaxID=2886038 RepID=UPI0021C37074|nr:DUF1700 domain-containing protein [Clostridium folliculivorans]GKU30259.1 hypothetical protein CFB3_23660 [Clostridium folliculivorans]
MKKDEFMREMERNLDKVSEAERKEILYDYEEHFRIAMENGKTDEVICMELGNPKEIAHSYIPNYKNENKFILNKKEVMKSAPVYNSNSRLLKPSGVFMVAAGIIIMLFTIHFIFLGNRSSVKNASVNPIKISEKNIDKSGIHGDGINIDKDGISMPGLNINDDGISAEDVNIDSNGISGPDFKIDDKGISTPDMKINDDVIQAPGIKIDDNGISMPGIKIDDNGISMPGIKIDKDGVKIN